MTIPSDLPHFVAATRSWPLQALALQAGQVIDARIIGPAPNGGTQVEIRGQLLNLVLPTLVTAGETLRLEVQGSGQQLRLALQAATTTQPTAGTPVTVPPPQASMPLPSLTTPAPIAPTAPTASPTPTLVAQPAIMLPAGTIADAAPSLTSPVQVPAGPASPAGGPAPVSTQALPVALAVPAGPPSSTTTGALPTGLPSAPASVTPSMPMAPTNPAPLATAIYPQAAPAVPNPLASAVAATANVPPAPMAAPAAGGAVRPVLPATAIANATAHSTPGDMLPQQPSQPSTPQAALAQMVHSSVPQQGSVTALTTALVAIAGKVALPEPVARAAQQVLAGRVAIDAPRFDGAALQAALRGSGVFQEATLAKGQPLLPDMKSSLLALRQTLTSWLGQQAPVAAVAPIPPPLRGVTPRARTSESPPPLDAGAAPEEVGRHLLERTESALARVRLHQHASLPDPVGRNAEWSMDLPVMVGTHQTLMQLQIHRDQHTEQDSVSERGWQMRFAMNLPEMGEVGAQVSLRAGAVGVMLWATDNEASAALEAEIVALREALANAGLQPGAVIVRHGEPPVLPAAPSGHFVDART